jgi:hypothetical protein
MKGDNITLEVLAGRNKNNKTASIIFTIDPSDRQTYFTIARKVPDNSRIRGGPNKGAAGTNPRYFGKWGSFGGGKKVYQTELEGALEEINDESGTSIYNKNGYYITREKPKLLELAPIKANGHKIYLVKAIDIGNTTLFIFYFNYKQISLFFKYFPKFNEGGRQGSTIVGSSFGETDVCASITLRQMVRQQKMELQKPKKNNFFLSYFLQSFQLYVMPVIGEVYTAFKKTHLGKKKTIIPSIQNTIGRDKNNVHENPIGKKYKEVGFKHGKPSYKLE